MAVGGLGSTLWFYITRGIGFLRRPPVAGEYALLALFNIAAIVVIAGLIWQRDLRVTLLIAGVIGLATRALDRDWLRISWRSLGRLVLTVTVLAIFAVLGLVGGVVLAIDTHHWRAVPAVVPAIKARPEIHVLPCPSPEETLAQRPDGSYVCLYTIPPDPGSGPVLASPAT